MCHELHDLGNDLNGEAGNAETTEHTYRKVGSRKVIHFDEHTPAGDTEAQYTYYINMKDLIKKENLLKEIAMLIRGPSRYSPLCDPLELYSIN